MTCAGGDGCDSKRSPRPPPAEGPKLGHVDGPRATTRHAKGVVKEMLGFTGSRKWSEANSDGGLESDGDISGNEAGAECSGAEGGGGGQTACSERDPGSHPHHLGGTRQSTGSREGTFAGHPGPALSRSGPWPCFKSVYPHLASMVT